MTKYLLTIILISACVLAGCQKHERGYYGYVEANFRFIKAEFPGLLFSLDVQRGSKIRKGQSLFTLETEPQDSQVIEANANVKMAKSQIVQLQLILKLEELKLNRREKLHAKNHIGKEAVDISKINVEGARNRLRNSRNQLKAAEAILQQSKWTKGKKTVLATTSGIVHDLFFRVGEHVQIDRPVMSIFVPGDIRAVFYIPQDRIGTIKIGEKVQVSCDNCKEGLVAYISFISPEAEFTPPVIFSEKTRKHLVFLVEAKFPEKDKVVLNPGQPVTVKLDGNHANKK